MAKAPVTLEFKGKIAVITIDNEQKLNALDQDGYYALASSLRDVAAHDEVFVTVLTGKGKCTFTLLERFMIDIFSGRYFSA